MYKGTAARELFGGARVAALEFCSGLTRQVCERRCGDSGRKLGISRIPPSG